MNKKHRKGRKAKAQVKLRHRNPIAVAAFLHSGSGRHKDRKKEHARRACRGKIRA